MITKFYVTLFGLFLSFQLIAQEVMLKGVITNEKEVEGIHVLNTSSRYNTVTNESGHFSIRVKESDTLVISSVHYVPEKRIISEEIFEKQIISITLTPLINELDEVVLGPNLSGNLATDLKNIETTEPINFDDVGIPGFKGKPEEKIVPVVPYIGLVTAVDVEALYKHLSGYYRKLRLKRKWDEQNYYASYIINYYGAAFFEEAFGLPENRLFDFLLFCMETTDLKNDFQNEKYALVLQILETQSAIYLKRLEQTLENEHPKKEE